MTAVFFDERKNTLINRQISKEGYEKFDLSLNGFNLHTPVQQIQIK